MATLTDCKNQNVLGDLDNVDSIKGLLDNVCHELVKYFNLYDSDGRLKKASIIETLSGFTCLSCIYRKLRETKHAKSIDAIYRECHKLAVNILVERLYWLLNRLGYKVEISSEAELDLGKADIIITLTKFGVSLKHETKELIVEVKTGNSLSFSQLFRYIVSGKGNSVVVWRIRRRQILVLNVESLKPLLAEFAAMIYLRANRLLSSPQITCTHELRKDHQPPQKELQIALHEFAQGLIETLPHVIAVTLRELSLQNWEVKLLNIKQT